LGITVQLETVLAEPADFFAVYAREKKVTTVKYFFCFLHPRGLYREAGLYKYDVKPYPQFALWE
jgi:hypothetical protein